MKVSSLSGMKHEYLNLQIAFDKIFVGAAAAETAFNGDLMVYKLA